jgi:DNA phosphorothioation-dependent restriction protein DptH
MTLQPISEPDLYEVLSRQLLPQIKAALASARAGQRLRVTTLPVQVMDRLCQELHGASTFRTCMLAKDADGAPWRASSTKIIELRNVLREPLLVFIPPELRTAAEDSLDIATFTELAFRNVSDEIQEVLLVQLPEKLRQRVEAALKYIRLERILQNVDEAVEYLLTVVKNGSTPEAAGAALYCLGLVPDLAGFQEVEIEKRLSRNWNAARVLDDSGSPWLARIQKLRLEPDTIQKRLFVFLRDRKPSVRVWGRDLAQRSEWSDLSFDRWRFVGDVEETAGVRIIVEELDLPLQVPDEVAGAAQLPVLDLENARTALKMVFRSQPRPAEVPAWTHYRFQILSTPDEVPLVAWESNSYPKPVFGRNKSVRRSVKAKDLQSLEEGTYFVKVDAYDANGNLLTTVGKLDPRSPLSHPENESEYFLVVRGETEVEEPEPRAVFATSLLDAWAALAARALGGKERVDPQNISGLYGRWAEPMKAPTRGDVHFALEHSDGAGQTVVVPGLFRKVEAEILAHPEQLGLYRLNLAVPKLADVTVEPREQRPWQTAGFDDFLATRVDLFRAISEQHASRAPAGSEVDRSGIMETADLCALEKEVRAYIDGYLELASGSRSKTILGVLAQLDIVELRWKPSQVDGGRALLIAPTHPVRVAWHLQHARQLRRLVEAWRLDAEAAYPDLRELVTTFRRDVQPTHAPPVIFDGRGRGYVEQGPLTSHWSLYLPDAGAEGAAIDVAASRDRVRTLLGVGGRASRSGKQGVLAPAVGSKDLAVRLFEYLQLHPYVEQLHLNVFNPGDAALMAEALRELEKQRRSIPGEPQLRYLVRLFAPSAGVDLTGDELESLLDPDRQVGEDDEFTLASSNHLHPKLVFARNSVEDFLARASEFTAHVSVMLEQFAVSARVGRIDGMRRGSFVAGLLQEPEIRSEASGGVFAWQKGLNPRPSTVADDWERLLVRALGATQEIQARSTLGVDEPAGIGPLLAMQLDTRGQALLKQVHVASDWVFTLDRNLGLEFYDSPTAAREAGYLLDFAPEYLQQDRLRLMLTTRSTHELESIVRPAVESFGLRLPEHGEVAAIEALRSLSGRLALRFMSSTTQTAEVVGLLLARWLLEHTGVLADRVVVPLDAHRSWFSGTEGRQQRADLLLVSFDGKTRTVFGKVVEVKLREELPAATRTQLYQTMRYQSDNTIEVFRLLFDPQRFAKPRADGLLRAKELSTALAFYVRRARRYRLLGEAEAEAALDFVQDLDAGYSLDLSSLGVVFERTAAGAHLDEDEPGYVVHRFGLDAANRLVQGACDRFTRAEASIRSSETVDSEASRPSSPPPADSDREPEFDSFRDAVDRSSPSLSKMVPESERLQRVSVPLRDPTASPAAQISPGPDPPAASEQLRGLGTSASAHGDDGGEARPVAAGEEAISPAAPGAGSKEYVTPPVKASWVEESVRPAQQGSRSAQAGLVPDVLVGSTELTSQYGVLGKFGSATVGLDLNGCNTVSLFGVQGFGKSYTLGVISEMATKAVSGINVLPAPLATVIFHYHKSDAYAPEYASAVLPNHKAREVEALRIDYGAAPAALDDVVLLAPEAKIEERRREFPSIEVRPIKFSSGELGAESWKFLLGAYGNDSLYVRQMVQIMRQHRSGLTLDVFREEITNSGLPASSRNLADTRITFAQPYIDDAARLGDLLRPGRTVIVDLRDEWIEKDEALGLFVVMLRIFAASKHEGRDFNKLVVFDEAHKYITESDLIGQVVETIREMRHQATSVIIASQDPLSVPRAVIELTSILLLHRMTSPQWLKHLKSAISALEGVTEGHVAGLKPGEALLWAQRATDARFTQRPQKITIRPRFTQHGGGTKTAVAGQTVR